MKQKKKKRWTKKRHAVVRNILNVFLKPYSYIKYGIKVKKFKEQGKRNYLILFNHQTAFDQFFVGMAFRGPVYYVASEDLFSNGWVSSLIRFLVEPIPIKKQTTDVRAVLDCIKVSREGGTIAIAPEGNRTYSGRTEYINPAIAPLARKLGIPIALYRLEGGYGVHPRWADKVRKGKMTGYVSRVVEPEEYAALSDDELYELIKKELYVDESTDLKPFYHKKNAEYLERVFYYCPFCKISEFESKNDIVSCKRCSRKIKYLQTKELSGIGFDFPYRFVSEWYDAQNDYMRSTELDNYKDTKLYSKKANVFEVIIYKNKKLIEKSADVTLYGDRISVGNLVFPFSEISAVTVLGRNKLNIYHNKRIYQLKSAKSFNALIFVNSYYRYKNISEGVKNGQFLGL